MILNAVQFIEKYNVYGIVGMFAAIAALYSFWTALQNAEQQRLYQAWQLINSSQQNPAVAGRAIAIVDLYKSGEKLSGVSIASTRLERASLPNIDLSYSLLTGSTITESDLHGANLRFVRAEGVNFAGTCMAKANLSHSDLKYSNFYGADLEGADFSMADLSGADLSFSSLDGANLRGANLSGADVRGASMAGVNLIDADLEDLQHWRNVKTFRKAIIAGARNLPSGFRGEIRGRWGGYDDWKISETKWSRDVKERYERRTECKI